MLLRGTKFEGNRSSPLYAICLNWIHEIQFVDFDSKLFYGRHCQIEPDGEHPTSIERFILPTKPDRSREFNPFHRKHHKASNASSERRSNKTVSKVPLFSVEHPHMVKGDRLRGIGFHLSMHLNPNRALSHPNFVCRCYTDTQICNFLPLF